MSSKKCWRSRDKKLQNRYISLFIVSPLKVTFNSYFYLLLADKTGERDPAADGAAR